MSGSGAPTKLSGRFPGGSLARRILTAGLLVPLAVGAVLLGGRVYAGLIAAMSVFLIFEWTRIVDGAELQRGFYALSLTAALSIYLAAGGLPVTALAAALIGGAFATLLEWPKENPQSWPMAGALYIIVPAAAALWLRRDSEAGAFLTLLLFVCVWAADSAALIVGKLAGGPKLAPMISPQKTWSGALGAVAAGAVAAYLLQTIWRPEVPVPSFLVGAILGAAAVVGDISESALKRRYGLKDSGGAFPGHGGVLDRLDGFLFAVLALAVIVLFLQANP